MLKARGLLLGFVVMLGLSLQAAQQDLPGSFRIVTDIVNDTPEGVSFPFIGEKQESFLRPTPKTLDPTIFQDFRDSYTFMQEFAPEFDSPYNNMSTMYVAAIPHAFVQGESGLVFDAQGNIYHEKNFFLDRVESVKQVPKIREDGMCDVYYPTLATTIQRYGHMYYHFVAETLSKVIMLQPFLSEDVKLLIWGQPYEYEFLQMLGIPQDQIEVYNPQQTYCTGELLMPTPTARITPAKEGLEMVREAYNADSVLPEESRNLIIYVTRRNEDSRRVSNEQTIINAIKKEFPDNELVIFDGESTSVEETVDLFKRAKIVMGPHGAGLSHILFSAPGTHVIEFLFMQHPPMMFWHISAALRQNYWMLPVPHSYWMQDSFEVPVSEVMDIMHRINDNHVHHVCAPGSYEVSLSKCHACEPGTYAYNWEQSSCKACPNGRYAPNPGSSACKTCPTGTYSDEKGVSCKVCPQGTVSTLTGAWKKEQCLNAKEQQDQMQDPDFQMKVFSKLSPTFRNVAASRRRMMEQQNNSTSTFSNRLIDFGGATVYNRPLWDQEFYCTLLTENPSILEPYIAPYMAPLVPEFDCIQRNVTAFEGPDVDGPLPPGPDFGGPVPIVPVSSPEPPKAEPPLSRGAPVPTNNDDDNDNGAYGSTPSLFNLMLGLFGAILIAQLLY